MATRDIFGSEGLMAYDYTYTPNANLETGKPARAVDIRAIRDMAPAIAEGAKGAPRILPKALDSNLLLAGRISGGSGYIGVNNILWVKRIRIVMVHQGSGSRQYVDMSRSNDNGVTWLPDAALFDWNIPNGTNNTFTAEIDLRANFSASSGEPVQAFSRSNATNAIRFKSGGGGPVVGLFITAVSGRDDV